MSRYSVGDKFHGDTSPEPSGYYGLILDIFLDEDGGVPRYYIGWHYEDGHVNKFTYNENWVVDYVKDMKYESGVKIELDEDLFTI